MIADLKKIWAIFTPAERRKSVVMLILVILMALAETLGVLSIMPFLSVLSRPEAIQRRVGRNSKAYCAACSPSRSIAQAWMAAQAADRLYLRSTGSWRRCAVMLSIRMDHAPFKPAENIRRITACGLMSPYAGDAIA